MLKKILYTLLFLTLVAAIIGFIKYRQYLGPYVEINGHEYQYIYIPKGTDIDGLFDLLNKEGILSDTASFTWLAGKKNLARHIHPGKYKIRNGSSLNGLINQLRAGKQVEVELTFNNVRTKQELAGLISRQVQCDSTELLATLFNDSLTQSYGFDTLSITAMFIPNTYKVYWAMTAEGIFARMHKEYKRFWSRDRKKKARNADLTEIEVAILASIVQEETVKQDEKPRVAGLYINRLNRGIALQADPTLKYALRNFAKKRIINADKKVKSKYNTYKYTGLPPGPISIPSIGSLDAVLNYESHGYIYMCAKEDFSGYHNFASTLLEHNLNARRYQKQLNKKRIYK